MRISRATKVTLAALISKLKRKELDEALDILRQLRTELNGEVVRRICLEFSKIALEEGRCDLIEEIVVILRKADADYPAEPMEILLQLAKTFKYDPKTVTV